jgi:CO/xanthine dehydrogenase FAD-binding subunit
VKPAPFDLFVPDTVEEALALLAEHGDDAKVLAGGQSLIPVLNFRLAKPSVLIDLNRIPSLAGIEALDRGVRIGAMTRQREAERSTIVADCAPLMAEALPFVAHVQIRNRGTVGGSLAHADPAAELPSIMLVLDATFRLRTSTRERRLAATDFFTDFFATALSADELIVDMEVPAVADRSGFAFMEIARRHGDFALLGVAATVALDEAGRCREARLAYVNAGPGPTRATTAEALATGADPGASLWEAMADAAASDLDFASDVHASAEYRRHLAGVLTKRALTRALERAQ